MAGPVDNEFLIQAATYLGATVVAVPLFRRLKMSAIVGFLFAGMVLGEQGLGLLKAQDGVFQIAELGVVLLLFIIGLELSLSRLWDLRRNIFGLGFAQMLITGLLIGAGLYGFGIMERNAAFMAGFALACSSTAFALSLLQERMELNTPYGTKAFSILLFQDIAVIPLLAAIPFVAPNAAVGGDVDITAMLRAVAVIFFLILISRFVLNHIFRLVAISGSREAFTATALFVVAATSLAVSSVGLSMALGAFLAGVFLAESSFRHQIEADIEPFRELLLGLFFIGVGMQLDLGLILDQWLLIGAAALGLVAIKMIIIYLLARLFKTGRPDSLRAAGVLSQGGEFGFVVFSLGAAALLFTTEEATMMSAIITLSMIMTPIVLMLIGLVVGRLKTAEPDIETEEAKDLGNQVLVVGFGRMGQIVSQVLNNSGVSVTTIDNDPKRIENARKFGNKVYFGDGFNLNLLLAAGAASADAVVFTVIDNGQLRSTIEGLRAKCPKVLLVVRAHDRMHEMELMDAEIDHIVRETLESSLDMAGRTLNGLGKSDGFVADVKEEFRLRDRERLLEQKAGDMYAGKEKLSQPYEAARKKKHVIEDKASS